MTRAGVVVNEGTHVLCADLDPLAVQRTARILTVDGGRREGFLR